MRRDSSAPPITCRVRLTSRHGTVLFAVLRSVCGTRRRRQQRTQFPGRGGTISPKPSTRERGRGPAGLIARGITLIRKVGGHSPCEKDPEGKRDRPLYGHQIRHVGRGRSRLYDAQHCNRDGGGTRHHQPGAARSQQITAVRRNDHIRKANGVGSIPGRHVGPSPFMFVGVSQPF